MPNFDGTNQISNKASSKKIKIPKNNFKGPEPLDLST